MMGQWLRCLAVTMIWLATPAVSAEPFLAVQEGYQCGQCHVSPAGGGMRNAFGSVFSQSQLAAGAGALDLSMLGEINERVNIGADVRSSGRMFDGETVDNNLGFATDRVTLYLSAKLSDSVGLYVDEQIAPGGAINREAWAKIKFDEIYVRAGRFFLPYGLRLEDNSAYIRQFTNINFNVPDTGVELGYIGQKINAQLSVTNGTGGTAEIDSGKQANLRLAWIDSRFRVGASFSTNDTDTVDRTMYGVFAGLRTGPVSWLAEVDRITDQFAGVPDSEQDLMLVEANLRIAKGHYLRVTAESRSIDGASMDHERLSVEYQWFPVPFTQLRVGGRSQQSDELSPVPELDEYFVQLHVYF